MTLPWQQWIIAVVLAVVIVAAALRLRALAPSGAIAAAMMGTVVVGTGGWWAGIILVAFFASSSAVSHLQPDTSIEQARGSQRDLVQVIANGWGMLAGSVLFAITDWWPWFLFGTGAIAAATADTWSSEIGRTSTSPPRLITTWRPVPHGTSGAVSMRGLLASVTGAALIAILTAIAISRGGLPITVDGTLIIVVITLGGVFGALVDSLVGATVQEQRFCDACNGRTETNPHSCGNHTYHVGGLRGLNNDVVNFLCVLTGALIGLFSGIL